MGESHRMKKIVFFNDLIKLPKALAFFDIEDFINKTFPLKLHMGEKHNKHFVRPSFIAYVVKILKNLPSSPYLLDSTVAYPGLRHTKKGYLKLAREHHFTEDTIGCPVVIDDSGIRREVENRVYNVVDHIYYSKYIFAVSHVKGHIAAGMGGAIKNFGMGGVTKDTKIQMHHGSRPEYNKDSCTFCGICAEVCPFNAIEINQTQWHRDNKTCFGCGVCVENCASQALSYRDADLQFVLACAAKACVQEKSVLYLNELKRISKSCDCDPDAGPLICPDIGYIVGDDPVAVDQGSLDLINEVRPQVFEKENKVDPSKQIHYGEQIGLGSSKYQLIEL